MDQNPDNMNAADLYALAQELDLPGRSGLKGDKSALLVAVKAELAARAAAELQKKEEGVPAEEIPTETPPEAKTETPADDPDGPDSELHGPVTDDQLMRIMQAKTDQLEEIVNEPGMPEFLKVEIQAELKRRKKKESDKKLKEGLKSELGMYRVTKGGRYVAPGAYITELPVGSMVGPLTHNLEDLKAQGIEFKEAVGLKRTQGQLGTVSTEPLEGNEDG